MMKDKYILIVVWFLLIGHGLMAQKYFSRTGVTNFKASEVAFEPIEATNNSTSVILKSSTGDIAAQLFITAFKFKVALMQEHFNENYMDSDQYPKAIFRGKLKDFSLDKIVKENSFLLNGTLKIRNVEKKINTEAMVSLKNNKILLSTKFIVKAEDFGIKIPAVVRSKIAKDIQIEIAYELSEKK